jgi:hypothetical protein
MSSPSSERKAGSLPGRRRGLTFEELGFDEGLGGQGCADSSRQTGGGDTLSKI